MLRHDDEKICKGRAPIGVSLQRNVSWGHQFNIDIYVYVITAITVIIYVKLLLSSTIINIYKSIKEVCFRKIDLHKYIYS